MARTIRGPGPPGGPHASGMASHSLNRQPLQPQPPFRSRSEVRNFSTAPPAIEKAFDVQIDHLVRFFSSLRRFDRHTGGSIMSYDSRLLFEEISICLHESPSKKLLDISKD